MKKFLFFLLTIYIFATPLFAATKQEILDNLEAVKLTLDKFSEDTLWVPTISPGGRIQPIPMDEKQYRAIQAVDMVEAMIVQLKKKREGSDT